MVLQSQAVTVRVVFKQHPRRKDAWLCTANYVNSPIQAKFGFKKEIYFDIPFDWNFLSIEKELCALCSGHMFFHFTNKELLSLTWRHFQANGNQSSECVLKGEFTDFAG